MRLFLFSLVLAATGLAATEQRSLMIEVQGTDIPRFMTSSNEGLEQKMRDSFHCLRRDYSLLTAPYSAQLIKNDRIKIESVKVSGGSFLSETKHFHDLTIHFENGETITTRCQLSNSANQWGRPY